MTINTGSVSQYLNGLTYNGLMSVVGQISTETLEALVIAAKNELIGR